MKRRWAFPGEELAQAFARHAMLEGLRRRCPDSVLHFAKGATVWYNPASVEEGKLLGPHSALSVTLATLDGSIRASLPDRQLPRWSLQAETWVTAPMEHAR